MNRRAGSITLAAALRPTLPPSSRAVSAIVTVAPAQGLSARSAVVSPVPSPRGAAGSDSGSLGGSTRWRPVAGLPATIGSDNRASAPTTP